MKANNKTIARVKGVLGGAFVQPNAYLAMFFLMLIIAPLLYYLEFIYREFMMKAINFSFVVYILSLIVALAGFLYKKIK